MCEKCTNTGPEIPKPINFGRGELRFVFNQRNFALWPVGYGFIEKRGERVELHEAHDDSETKTGCGRTATLALAPAPAPPPQHQLAVRHPGTGTATAAGIG